MTTASVPARGALPIGQLACRVLATVAPEDSLRDVLAELAAQEVGVVLVRSAHGLAGVLSERDAVCALAAGADPDATQAIEITTRDLVTAPAGTPVAEVGRLMVDTGVRHVLVGPQERPDAIVSMRDVLAVLLGPGSELAGDVRSDEL